MPGPGHIPDQPAPPPDRPGDAGSGTSGQPEPAEHLSDEQFRTLLDRGPIAPLSVWRRAYHTVGIDWPGQAEVRRRHRVTDTDTGTPPPTTVWQMSWQPDRGHTHGERDHHHDQPDRRHHDQPAQTQQPADALGRDHLPTLTPEEHRPPRLACDVAQEQARHLYGHVWESEQVAHGWDGALRAARKLAGELAAEVGELRAMVQKLLER